MRSSKSISNREKRARGAPVRASASRLPGACAKCTAGASRSRAKSARARRFGWSFRSGPASKAAQRARARKPRDRERFQRHEPETLNPAASHLVRRVLGWQAAFTLFVSALVAALAPQFLRRRGSLAIEGATAVGLGVLAGGVPALAIGGARLRRYRFLLRALAVGSKAVEAHELYELADEPRRGIVAWFVPSALGIGIATLLVTPRELDL